MKEINLNLVTKKIDCVTIKIKTEMVVEEGKIESIIPKNLKSKIEKLLN